MNPPNEGFIKLSRSFFNHHLWREERTYSLAEAWLDLIQMARFDVAPQSMVIKMKTITIHRGELRASQRYLAQRWNWSVGKVNRFLKMLEDERGLERRNEHSETIIKLCKYELYNPISNEYLNNKINANETLAEHRQIQIKESKERKEDVLLEKEPKERENIGEDNFSGNSENSEPLNTEQKQKEKSSAKKEKGFIPPTIQEVQDHCTERQNGIDAENFWNFYQSKGWMVGKNKMKDWKACVITWEKTRKKENANNRNSQYAGSHPATKPSGKTSYRTLVAREFNKNAATPNDSENITIDIEAV